jgi:hypothetical protein
VERPLRGRLTGIPRGEEDLPRGPKPDQRPGLSAGLEGLLHPRESRQGCRRYEAHVRRRRCSGHFELREDFMSNQELIRSFENDAISEESFHHADHVRLAFAYFSEYPVLRARA